MSWFDVKKGQSVGQTLGVNANTSAPSVKTGSGWDSANKGTVTGGFGWDKNVDTKSPWLK